MFIYRRLNQLIFLWTILLLGCTYVVKPNNPISGPYPVPLEKLIEENRILSFELCRLPEIQDGISLSDIDALERFYKMYIKNKALLFEAWNFEPNNEMSKNDIETIISEMKNEKIQAEYQFCLS